VTMEDEKSSPSPHQQDGEWRLTWQKKKTDVESQQGRQNAFPRGFRRAAFYKRKEVATSPLRIKGRREKRGGSRTTDDEGAGL